MTYESASPSRSQAKYIVCQTFNYLVNLVARMLSGGARWEEKIGLLGPVADPADGPVDGGDSDEAQFEGAFAGEIHEDESDENGEDALAGGEDHNESGEEKNEAEGVFQGLEENVGEGMARFEGFGERSALEEVVRRHPADENGHEEDADEEGRERDRGEGGEETGSLGQPIRERFHGRGGGVVPAGRLRSQNFAGAGLAINGSR